MEADHSQNFNERLSEWVARQGFWFQLRHPISGQGAFSHFLSLVTKIGIFLGVVVVVGFLLYLKMQDSPSRRQAIESAMGRELGAHSLKAKNLSQSFGTLKISRLTSSGGENTFYENLEAVAFQCSAGMFGSVMGDWDVGPLNMDRLDMELRAGANTADSAAQIGKVFFDKAEQYRVDGIHAEHVFLRWGENDRMKGFIQNSTMSGHRSGNRWLLSFKGGTFSQSLLNELEIVELVVSCTPQLIVIEKGSFRGDGGTVEFKDVQIVPGVHPQVKGLVKIQHLKLDGILPGILENYISGSISGNFKLSGSLNTAEGIVLDGRVNLGGADFVMLRDGIQLLEALTVVDGMNKYRRMIFTEGGFTMKTGNGGVVLSDVNMKSGELFSLTGGLRSRMPTFEEHSQLVMRQLVVEANPRISDDREMTGQKDPVVPESKKKQSQETNQPDQTLTDVERTARARQEAEKASELSIQNLRYEGGFQITLKPDALDRAVILREKTKKDEITGRFVLDVPIEGSLEELTGKQAAELIEKGSR